MSAGTSIEWTDHTFNAWHGCTQISPGCKNCYAKAWDARTLYSSETHWGPAAPRWIAGESVWEELERLEKARAKVVLAHQRDVLTPRPRVFCLSMGDVCEEHPALEAPRARLRSHIELSLLRWLLLSKRPHLYPGLWWKSAPDHVALGASVEDQETADNRTRALVEGCGGRWRFLSVEPLLERVRLDLERRLCGACSWSGEVREAGDVRVCRACGGRGWRGVNWTIVGLESGSGARSAEVAWVVDVVEQCRAAGVPVFVKQLGRRPRDGTGPLKLRHKKGADPKEWPPELLCADGAPVRELPSEWTQVYRSGGEP